MRIFINMAQTNKYLYSFFFIYLFILMNISQSLFYIAVLSTFLLVVSFIFLTIIKKKKNIKNDYVKKTKKNDISRANNIIETFQDKDKLVRAAIESINTVISTSDGKYIWCLDKLSRLYYKNGDNGEWILFTQNIQVKQITVADNLTLYGIDENGDKIYRAAQTINLGVNIEQSTVTWSLLFTENPVKFISVSSDNGYLFGIPKGNLAAESLIYYKLSDTIKSDFYEITDEDNTVYLTHLDTYKESHLIVTSTKSTYYIEGGAEEYKDRNFAPLPSNESEKPDKIFRSADGEIIYGTDSKNIYIRQPIYPFKPEYDFKPVNSSLKLSKSIIEVDGYNLKFHLTPSYIDLYYIDSFNLSECFDKPDTINIKSNFYDIKLLGSNVFSNEITTTSINRNIGASNLCIYNSEYNKVTDMECITLGELGNALTLPKSRRDRVCIDEECIDLDDIKFLNGEEDYNFSLYNVNTRGKNIDTRPKDFYPGWPSKDYLKNSSYLGLYWGGGCAGVENVMAQSCDGSIIGDGIPNLQIKQCDKSGTPGGNPPSDNSVFRFNAVSEDEASASDVFPGVEIQDPNALSSSDNIEQEIRMPEHSGL